MLEAELEADRAAGEGVAATLRACAAEEAEIQQRLRERGEAVTAARSAPSRRATRRPTRRSSCAALAERLGLRAEPAEEPLDRRGGRALRARIERLVRRREQLGPVNPLAKAEYDEAVAHVEELERQRTDLETALRELRALIRDTDRQIRETFEETFAAAARELRGARRAAVPGRPRPAAPRARGRRAAAGARRRRGGADDDEAPRAADEAAADGAARRGRGGRDRPADDLGVEIEITPAGKSMKRLTLLSGGEKSMTAIAFLFAVFLARPCPFYILDEVEAALDDLNIDRFLDLLRALRRPRPVHRRDAPEAHDGGG